MGLKTNLSKSQELLKKQDEFLKQAPTTTFGSSLSSQIEYTKQTLKIDRSKYKVIRDHCFERKISFQDFIIELIDDWISRGSTKLIP